MVVLLVGRLGDLFGRRYFLIGGQFLGLIGAIVCATAKNVPTVIGGSVLCGLAASVQLTFSFVIAELVPNKMRPTVNAGIFLTTFPFAAFGGLFAQLLIANTEKSWRWSYYLNMITCGLSVILFVFCYFPPGWESKHKGVSKMEGLKKFDYLGFVLYAGGLVLVLLGLCKLNAKRLLAVWVIPLILVQLGEVVHMHGAPDTSSVSWSSVLFRSLSSCATVCLQLLSLT